MPHGSPLASPVSTALLLLVLTTPRQSRGRAVGVEPESFARLGVGVADAESHQVLGFVRAGEPTRPLLGIDRRAVAGSVTPSDGLERGARIADGQERGAIR